MRPPVELNQLKYFYFTVLEGGVSPAADLLCVQQPVVSKMIKSLEDQLGKPLFWKEGRKKSLTDFGQVLYRHCQVIFDEIDRIATVQTGPETLKGSFNLAAAEPIAQALLPGLIDNLMTEFPNVHFNVHTSTAHYLLEMIAGRSFDIGLFFHIPALDENLEITKKIPVRFHLVCSPRERDNVEVLQSFIGSREIDDVSNHKFPTVDLLRKKYPKTRIIFSTNHFGLHKKLVLLGRGVSILPDFIVKEDLRKKRLVDLLPREEFRFHLKVVRRKASRSNLIIDKIISELEHRIP